MSIFEAKEFNMSWPRRDLPYLAGLVLSAVSCLAAPGRASEPQVSFALNAGWVDCSVRQDGKPVGGAVIQVLDERGVKFAEGETGNSGDAVFPMPKGSSCIVEIKTGERTADPIRLTRTYGGVEPARVLLSYGLRPCCRSLLSKPEPIIAGFPLETPVEANDSDFLRNALATALIGAGLVIGLIWWLGRRYRDASIRTSKE